MRRREVRPSSASSSSSSSRSSRSGDSGGGGEERGAKSERANECTPYKVESWAMDEVTDLREDRILDSGRVRGHATITRSQVVP